MRKLFTLVIFLLLAACGKKGALVPPEALVPAPVSDLKVMQRGESFLISWSPPEREDSGATLRNLEGFRIFRRNVLPPAEDCEECPSAYRLIKTVDLAYLQGVSRIGNRYLLRDSDLQEGNNYQYKVISFTKEGAESRGSNKARRKKLPAPLPPVLQAISSAAGIKLEFVAIPLPEIGRIEGYNLFRSPTGEPLPAIPLTKTPVVDNSYLDSHLEPGKNYSYAATVIMKTGEDLVESDLSNSVQGALSEPD